MNPSEPPKSPGRRTFTSDRERRLWISAMVVVVIIYVTLGLAGRLASSVSDQSLNAATFVLGALLIVAATVTQGLKRSIGPFEVFVAIGVSAVYVLVFTRLTSPVERSHLMEYGMVSILIFQALNERIVNGQRVRRPALIAVAVTAVIGTVDELIQLPLPNRVFDPVDIWFNIGAAVMAVGGGVALTWARNKRSSPPDRAGGGQGKRTGDGSSSSCLRPIQSTSSNSPRAQIAKTLA